MTNAQEKAINRLKKVIEDTYRNFSETYEYKRFEVEDGYSGTIFLSVEVGLKGDEGTMAEMFCREKAYFHIGVRGGVSYMSTYTKRSGFRPFHWYSFYEASLAYDGKITRNRK